MKFIRASLVLVILNLMVSYGNASTITRDTISGNAVRFDGTLDYIRILNSSSFNNFGSTFTATLWFKPEGVKAGFLFNKHVGSYEDKQFYISNNEYLQGYMFPLGGVNTTSAFDIGNWYHLSLRYDNSTMSIYIDGTLVASANMTGTIADSSGDLYISYNEARTGIGDTSLMGVVDEMRFYSRPLDPTEIEQDYNDGVAGIKSTVSTDGLRAEWYFDEGTGNTIADTSGYGFDTGTFGTGVSAPTWVLGESAAVPEPMCLGLLLTGLIGLAFRKLKGDIS